MVFSSCQETINEVANFMDYADHAMTTLKTNPNAKIEDYNPDLDSTIAYENPSKINNHEK